jgi:rfaE bifunctional protein kinase chain/domain
MVVQNESQTVFVSGVFNILHPGHIRLLRFAREMGSRLVVAVTNDESAGSTASVPESLRLESVKSLRFVDDAFLFNGDVNVPLLKLRPGIVVKGREHSLVFNPETKALMSYGGRLVFGSGEAFFSSDDLIASENLSDVRGLELPTLFMKRHGITKDGLVKILDDFSTLKVIVIGDIIVDEYLSCHALGMSQEDPTVVVTPIDTERFLGGAGIVAAHASRLGASAKILSAVGDDETANHVRMFLDEYQVEAFLQTDTGRPTTLKQRYRAGGQTLLRVSHLHQGNISTELQQRVIERIQDLLDDTDVIIFSDFNYGVLPQSLVESISSVAKSRGILIAADSQSSSQIGNIARFTGMDLITPTEREARLALRDSDSGLVILADELRALANAKTVFLTLGPDGILVRGGTDPSTKESLTEQVEALNSHPIDVAGGGDSLLVSATLALASGANVHEAALLSSIAAAIQVSRLGNTPLRLDELKAIIGA